MKPSSPSAIPRERLCPRVFALAAAALCILGDQTQAQPAIEWQAAFGGAKYDQLESILETSDGLLLGGYSYSGMTGNKSTGNQGEADYWIVKTDENGIRQWESSFGGTDNDYFHALAPLPGGGYLLAGSSWSPMSGDRTVAHFGDSDYWLIKVDANGDKQWEQVYGGTFRDFVETTAVLGDGNILIVGDSESNISGNKTFSTYGGFDYWIVKMKSTDGTKIWERSYGGLGEDYCYVAVPTPDGGFLLGGESNSDTDILKTAPQIGRFDFWLLKLDSNGTREWDKTFGGEFDDWMRDAAPTADGGWLIGGTSRSGSSGNKTTDSFGFADYWIVKINSQGDKQWDKSFGGDDSDYLDSIVPTPDGNFLLCGFSYSEGSTGNKESPNRGGGFEDFWVVKIDADGNKLWEETYGGEDYDDLYFSKVLSDGGFVLGGVSRSDFSGNKTLNGFGDGDGWVIRLKAEMLPSPKLMIGRSGEDLMLSWPASSTGFVLEENSTSDINPSDWYSHAQSPVPEGENFRVIINPTEMQTHFRLKKTN